MDTTFVKAPATCPRCRIQFLNPTTGLVGFRCYKCGEPITSDSPVIDYLESVKKETDTMTREELIQKILLLEHSLFLLNKK